MSNLKEFEEKINYSFRDISILDRALTHSSYAYENGTVSNERMEFLGDSVLSLATANYLYDNFPDLSEGDLSKLRSFLVCTQSLANFSNEIEVGKFLHLGKGESHNGGAKNPTILENTFESLVAAVYLDGGLEQAKKFVLRFIVPELNSDKTKLTDFKTKLQEVVQKNPDQALNYVISGEFGPDHDKTFECEVHLNSNVIGKGTGRTKKQAEQQAAKEALELFGIK